MAQMTPRISIKQSIIMGMLIAGSVIMHKCGNDAFQAHQKAKQKESMKLYKKTLAEQVQPQASQVQKTLVLGSR